MNGKELERVKSMDDATWRGYLAGVVEGHGKQLVIIGKNQSKIFGSINDIQIQLAEMSPECIEKKRLEKFDERIDCLEKDQAGRKAVKSILLGAGGGGGFVGVVFLILRYIFNLF